MIKEIVIQLLHAFIVTMTSVATKHRLYAKIRKTLAVPGKHHAAVKRFAVSYNSLSATGDASGFEA